MNRVSEASNRLMTIREAGDFLGLSRSMIYELLRDGTLPSVQLRASRRIPSQAVYALALKGIPASSKSGRGA